MPFSFTSCWVGAVAYNAWRARIDLNFLDKINCGQRSMSIGWSRLYVTVMAIQSNQYCEYTRIFPLYLHKYLSLTWRLKFDKILDCYMDNIKTF